MTPKKSTPLATTVKEEEKKKVAAVKTKVVTKPLVAKKPAVKKPPVKKDDSNPIPAAKPDPTMKILIVAGIVLVAAILGSIVIVSALRPASVPEPVKVEIPTAKEIAQELALILAPAEEAKVEAPAQQEAPIVEESSPEVGQAVKEPEVVAVATGDFPEDLFLTPVGSTDSFNPESAWLISEPGVLLDATATFDRGSSTAEHYVQCPEGGFSYLSAGKGEFSVAGLNVTLESGEGVNNVVAVRCRIDDGLQDTDLNETIHLSGYVPGNVITSPMPRGAYISKDWFKQQLEVSSGLSFQSGGNCGASGCPKTYIHLLDVDSGFYQEFLVEKANIDVWNQIK